MPVSVRLDPESERQLTRLARATGKSKSELIRDAIRQLIQLDTAVASTPTYERLLGIIGIVDRGPGHRAARSEELLRALFAERQRRR